MLLQRVLRQQCVVDDFGGGGYLSSASRIRRTEVRPMSRRHAISAVLTPARWNFRIWDAFFAAVTGLPSLVPLRQASSSPARTRSRRMSRSNSEKTESSPAMARPVGVVRSRALLQTPASCESAAAESSDHAIMRRDAGIQTNAKHFLRFTLVAENPLRFRLCGCLFGGHLRAFS